MISEVVMPQMGADMKEGTILKWRKSEGDEVKRGEIIAEIETDKANVEIEAFGSGVFRKTLLGENETGPVGTVIAVIAAPEDDISKYESGSREPATATPASQPEPSTPPPEPPSLPTSPQPEVKVADEAGQPQQAPTPPSPTRAEAATARPEAPQGQGRAAASDNGRLRASPVARRLAEESGVDLANVAGTGPDEVAVAGGGVDPVDAGFRTRAAHVGIGGLDAVGHALSIRREARLADDAPACR